MLQDIPTETFREGSTFVLETERLMLRMPTLADVKAIARLANDRRIAENTRRLPHPYAADDARQFVTSIATETRDCAFLIETAEGQALGLCGLEWRERDTPELGYWLGADHWGRGYATEAARAVIDFAFETFAIERMVSGARVTNAASRRVLEKCGFQWTGVELHRFVALKSSTPVDRFRLERKVWASLKRWSAMTAHRVVA